MLPKYMFNYPCISLLGFYHATTPHILSELWYKVLRRNTLIILTMDVVQRIVLIVSIITFEGALAPPAMCPACQLRFRFVICPSRNIYQHHHPVEYSNLAPYSVLLPSHLHTSETKTSLSTYSPTWASQNTL
ncbi:hypothetical protein HZ326_12011 [Fusarium oxysporum f. sp. albedinis]|nr:hypothetical protein HZ326_12011 [Fusarium oxysporum f. sp. albedinis]